MVTGAPVKARPLGRSLGRSVPGRGDDDAAVTLRRPGYIHTRVRVCRSSHRSDLRRRARHEPGDRRRVRDVERRGQRHDRVLERGDRRAPDARRRGARQPALVAADGRPTPAAMGLAPAHRAPQPAHAPARLHARAPGRRRADARAAAAGRPRLLHRRLQPRAEPDADDPGRRARAPLRAGLDRRHAGDQGRDDHRLPGRGRRRRAEAGGGGRVNLVGDCQGGWLAAIYAALHPERVNTLTIAGAPIDFHAGDAVIHDSVAGAQRRRPALLPRPGRPAATAC